MGIEFNQLVNDSVTNKDSSTTVDWGTTFRRQVVPVGNGVWNFKFDVRRNTGFT